MSTPLSLPHHRPPFSSDNPILKSPTTSTSSKTQRHPCLVSLEKCSSMSQLKQIHAQLLRTGLFSDSFTASKLVAFCALEGSGSLHYARLLFSQISNPTTYTCNSIIRGYTKNYLHDQALAFYQEMVFHGLLPDRFTFPSLLKACGDLKDGKQLHSHSTRLGFSSDSYIQNTLMNMYSSCGCLVSARKVFDKMQEKSVVSWATMISAYTQWDQPKLAIDVFSDMMADENVEANEITLINVLIACAKARDFETVKWVHEYTAENGLVSHVVLNAALIDAYCKCGCLSIARLLFDTMPQKNLVCWNIMIKGNVEDSNYEEALLLFREMQLKGVKGDKVTMVSLLISCSHMGSLELGRWIHAYIQKERIEVDVALGTALVDMYSKCGSIESALTVFHELPKRDVMTWTAIIVGLAMCGEGEKALVFFQEMQSRGVKPDAITFVGVLAACSHAGLVEEGISNFNLMSSKFGIQPSIEHYGNLVDILGRAGRIAEAEELIQSMPMAPDHFVLGGLLGACKTHGKMEIAERTAKQLLEIYPENGGTYVTLSNIYQSLGKREDAERIRRLMADRKIQKPPGCSLIEIDGAVHEFVKGDSSHPRCSEIYEKLDDMIKKLKTAGYVPDKSEVFLDMDEDEKETALGLHSEKLAIAFGLLSTSPKTTIRIVKNLRVCKDCHMATKLISKVYETEIIVRDRNRFHHFKNGFCSCKDFW